MSKKDIESAGRLLERLRHYAEQLREHSGLTEDQYLQDETIQDAVERRLQLCVEVAIDIGRHVLRALRARGAADYSDVFRALRENAVLSSDLTQRMQAFARYRNRLVHDYEDLDPAQVYSFRRDHAVDLDAYAEAVDRWLVTVTPTTE